MLTSQTLHRGTQADCSCWLCDLQPMTLTFKKNMLLLKLIQRKCKIHNNVLESGSIALAMRLLCGSNII